MVHLFSLQSLEQVFVPRWLKLKRKIATALTATVQRDMGMLQLSYFMRKQFHDIPVFKSHFRMNRSTFQVYIMNSVISQVHVCFCLVIMTHISGGFQKLAEEVIRVRKEAALDCASRFSASPNALPTCQLGIFSRSGWSMSVYCWKFGVDASLERSPTVTRKLFQYSKITNFITLHSFC